MNFECINDLRKHLFAKFAEDNQDMAVEIEPEICPPEMKGDITVNCFRFARIFKSNPMEIAKISADFLAGHDDVENVELIKAFVNLELKAGALHRDSVAKLDKLLSTSLLTDEERKKIMIEYSAPNTNKPLHLGHVRNNTLGMSLVSLLKRIGNEVVPINLVNDRGVHICKSMVGYKYFGNGETPESEGKKGDHLVGEFYVKYDAELKKQLAELRESKPEMADRSDDDLFTETEIGKETQQMLRDWEEENCEVRKLWEMMNSWVFQGFEETYKRMGVQFDKTFLESETYLLGKDIILEGIEKGVFFKREDGATVVDLGKKLGEKVLLRSDGTSVYITQDIGTTLMKYNEYKPDTQVWVVGDEQIYHFEVLFAILKKLGYSWAEDLHHLYYGMVNLPSGKMKSREGTVVDADDLFDEMHSLAKEATIERCGDDVPGDIEERSEIIAMGALKFMLLKFNPKTTIKFNPEESVKFEGDTGPYVQYACARISSMLRKAEEKDINLESVEIDWGLLSSSFEKNLSVRAFQYPSVLKRGGELLDCSGIVNYLLELAKDFSRFYRECPVLTAETDELRNARLEISRRVRDILKDGLKTLTIDVPEAM
jgi:arginyl-tRNA synthetase